MNLHSMVKGYIAIVNPMTSVTLKTSAGYTTGADGERTPIYANTTLMAQVQAVPGDMLAFLQNQGIQGVMRSVFLDGNINGIVQLDHKGGDILEFDGHQWLVVHVLQPWRDWTQVIVVQKSNTGGIVNNYGATEYGGLGYGSNA